MVKINEQLIPVGHPNRAGTKTIPIAVIVHYTANDAPSATDTANANYFARKYIVKNGVIYESNGIDKFRYGSTQWIIDQDSATLVIPQNEVSWGCGDRQLPYNNGYKGQTKIAYDIFNHKQNYLTINYEICNNDTIKNSNADWQMACNNAIEIIAQDMIKYNIPIDRIYKHQDLSGKICPKPFIDNPKSWEDFKNRIINKINNKQEGSESEVIMDKVYTCKRIVTTTLNVRTSPSTDGKILGQFKADEVIVCTGEVGNGWIRVVYQDQDGFCSEKYTNPFIELDYKSKCEQLSKDNNALTSKLNAIKNILD